MRGIGVLVDALDDLRHPLRLRGRGDCDVGSDGFRDELVLVDRVHVRVFAEPAEKRRVDVCVDLRGETGDEYVSPGEVLGASGQDTILLLRRERCQVLTAS